ncbi:hypothetical protein GCM10023350_27320 [Nocardioides endophyticus]|uniref:DUF3761 domain-containing protein n=1 Tax=Nocardioides endophyticus TaxID=1353775 RepID=A0ABP8YYD4_9ACTN
MKLRILLATFGLLLAGLVATPAVADVTPSDGVAASARAHACTRTSSGTCIRGGQFCPQSKYGRSGWDANGRRYVCKGNRTHPHWMRP